MSPAEIHSVYSVLRGCSAPCNLLVFGLTQESLLWNSLNHRGRTVFVDEYAFGVTRFEKRHPWVEAYDVRFSTKVRDLRSLIETSREGRRRVPTAAEPALLRLPAGGERPPQLHVRRRVGRHRDRRAVGVLAGYAGEDGLDILRGVMARTRGGEGGGGGTHVFVHEMTRRGGERLHGVFLCRENLVETVDMLGHFVVRKMGSGGGRNILMDFCYTTFFFVSVYLI
ncbi:hypothetical protein SASPL_157830 [Salvia splendens]|uniref:Uncharacterized protein n=1 Tax=Salvia splendens TaxID=180675 RepID=A0A8X8YVU1_SALSN|nr:hypothetical protein SASPL_157830 [Salvia splendens]